MEDAEQGERGGGEGMGGREREKRTKEGGKRDEKKGSLDHVGERRRKGERKRGKGRGKEADIVGQEEVERQGDR